MTYTPSVLTTAGNVAIQAHDMPQTAPVWKIVSVTICSLDYFMTDKRLTKQVSICVGAFQTSRSFLHLQTEHVLEEVYPSPQKKTKIKP